jgi:hypothetical protein
MSRQPAHVRNPVLALPAMEQLAELPPEVRRALARVMGDINRTSRERAQACWRRNKGPMALYWKAVGAYAGHIRRALIGLDATEGRP